MWCVLQHNFRQQPHFASSSTQAESQAWAEKCLTFLDKNYGLTEPEEGRVPLVCKVILAVMDMRLVRILSPALN